MNGVLSTARPVGKYKQLRYINITYFLITYRNKIPYLFKDESESRETLIILSSQ